VDALGSDKPNLVKIGAAKLGNLIGVSDAMFTAGTYAIVYDWQLEQAKEAGDAKAEETAHANTERIVDRLAQPTRTGTRSLIELTATSPAFRIMWAFASDSRKNVGLLAYAYAKKPARAKLGVTAFLLFNAAIAAVLRTALRDALSGDDDDEVFDPKQWDAKRIALAVATEPMNGIPYLGPLAQGMIFDAAGLWSPQGGLLSAATRVPDAVGNIQADLTGVLTTARQGALLLFVEVRQRGSDRFGGAGASVDHFKRKRLLRAAQHFLLEHFGDGSAAGGRRNGGWPACRFDVVTADGNGVTEWIQDAFQVE
jgi:putative endonuclease